MTVKDKVTESVNCVTVIIEAEHNGNQHRAEVSAQFLDGDFTRDDVLSVFEDALRGAGYLCPQDALDVQDEGEKAHLIAAAPDMLAALQIAEEILYRNGIERPEIAAAIAKATSAKAEGR